MKMYRILVNIILKTSWFPSFSTSWEVLPDLIIRYCKREVVLKSQQKVCRNVRKCTKIRANLELDMTERDVPESLALEEGPSGEHPRHGHERVPRGRGGSQLVGLVSLFSFSLKEKKKHCWKIIRRDFHGILSQLREIPDDCLRKKYVVPRVPKDVLWM